MIMPQQQEEETNTDRVSQPLQFMQKPNFLSVENATNEHKNATVRLFKKIDEKR